MGSTGSKDDTNGNTTATTTTTRRISFNASLRSNSDKNRPKPPKEEKPKPSREEILGPKPAELAEDEKNYHQGNLEGRWEKRRQSGSRDVH